MRRPLLILIALSLAFPLLRSQTYYYFQDSPDPEFYDFSWLWVNTPSELEVAGYDDHRFPVETTVIPQQGMNCLRMHWRSVTDGDWNAIAASMDWTEKNISDTDTLLFYFNSPDGLAKELLPKVFFEDVNNVKTTFQNIDPYTNDLPAGQWVRIVMPMSLFLNAGDPVDFTKIKTVGYGQSAADGAEHIVYVDDVRVFKGSGISPQVSPPQGVIAQGYDSHVFLKWNKNPEPNVSGYEIWRSADQGQTFTKKGIVTFQDTVFTDFVRLLGNNVSLKYTITALNDDNQPSGFSDTVDAQTFVMSDDEMMTMVQEATFRYFWDFAHPVSGLARERNSSGDVVTTGGSGFGVMAILVGIERGFIIRQQGIERILKMLNFLETADRFHGVWPHWMNGNNGIVVPFGTQDDGGDLVETAYMIEGLLAARSYFDQNSADEQSIRDKITTLWESVEWDWYRRNGQNVLYWHWSPNYGWAMNFQIRGWNECMIVYLLAIASPTHGVPASLWTDGWAAMSYYTNGKSFYGIPLDVGWDYGGPLFFAHYSFLGFDARHKKDMFTNYFINNTHTVLIDREYCIQNPKSFAGYNELCWGLTASDDPDGYMAHEPYSQDNGTITPTAALGSMPYTPAYSMEALKHFYRDRGDRLWGNMGFIDAFNLERNWFADSYLAIDQGPIIDMIENYRTGLLWELFMTNPEIQPALDAIGFVYDENSGIGGNQVDTNVILILCYPNPADDRVMVRFMVNEKMNIGMSLYDCTGRKVMQIMDEQALIQGNYQVEGCVDKLPEGMYFLKINDGQAAQMSKIIIHRLH